MAVDEYRYAMGTLQERQGSQEFFHPEEQGVFPQAYFDNPSVRERIHEYMYERGLPEGFYALAGFDTVRDGRPNFDQVLEKIGDVARDRHADINAPLGVHFYEAMCYAQYQEQASYQTNVAIPAHELFLEATKNAVRSGLPAYLAEKATKLRPNMLLKDDGFATIAHKSRGLTYPDMGVALFAPDLPPAAEIRTHIHEQLHLLEERGRNRWGIDRSLPQHPYLANTLREGIIEHLTLTLMGRDITNVHPNLPGPDDGVYLPNRYVLHELCGNQDGLGIETFIDAAFADTPPNLEHEVTHAFGHHPRVLNELESSCKDMATSKPGAKQKLADKASTLRN
jgi:hypothetical protein